MCPQLRHILKQVSRSFYLSLVILPRSVRTQVSLAYLFCRIADTIADTRILPQSQRLQALETWREQFQLPAPSFTPLEVLRAAFHPHQAEPGERQLMHHLPACLRMFQQLSDLDQQYIRELVLTLTQGMQMDLRCFPGDTAATARALPDLAALEQYTYYVAGCVGEFWTKIHTAHLPALQSCETLTLCQLGINFGKGLQLTNILRDIAKDFQHGRCYLPEKTLIQLRVGVAELEYPETLVRIRPLLRQLAWQTLEYLDQARIYILRLPYRSLRLRLSCMWPLLFAVQTVDAVCRAADLLRPEVRVKISRSAVYRTMFWSVGCLIIPGLFASYYLHLRQHLISTLGTDSMP